MDYKDIFPPKEFKSDKEKADYVNYLAGTILGTPPASVPDDPVNENKTEASDASKVSAVSSKALKPCVYKYVYIWPRHGHGFWAWLTNVDKVSASGYKWSGKSWVYFGIGLKLIDSFECY